MVKYQPDKMVDVAKYTFTSSNLNLFRRVAARAKTLYWQSWLAMTSWPEQMVLLSLLLNRWIDFMRPVNEGEAQWVRVIAYSLTRAARGFYTNIDACPMWLF